jgi:hypothetical protein
MNKTKLAVLTATALLSLGVTVGVSAAETTKQVPSQTVVFNGTCETDHDHGQEVNSLKVNRSLITFAGLDEDVTNQSFEIEDILPTNGKQPRHGFRWACKTKKCGYVSEWHALYSTAAMYAQAHSEKYDHLTTVYGV